MSYATIDDVFKRYKPIGTIVGSENVQVTSLDVASIFITDAESIIDAIVGKKYAVPLNPVPSFITKVAADIAIFNILMEHMPGSPDYFKPRYDMAMELLRSITSGDLIINSGTTLTTGDQEAWATTQDYHSVFSPVLSPEEQTVDKDRVDADVDAREGDIGATNNC